MDRLKFRWVCALPLCVLIFTSVLVECDVYVSPSLNDSRCSRSTCITLSQVAQTRFRENRDVNLILLSGNHSLSSKLMIYGVTTYSMRPEEGNSSVVINCAPHSNLEFSNIIRVRICGLTLNGCVRTVVNTVTYFTIEDSRLLGGHDIMPGSKGLIIIASRMVILGTSFMAFKPVSGRANPLEGNGSVLYGWNSTVDISNCSFTQNTGGALHAVSNSNFTILSSNFSHHTSVCDNESVVFSNRSAVIFSCSLFAKNVYHENFILYGGVIRAFESTVTVIETNFSNNTGGVLYCGKGSIIKLSYSNFKHSRVKENGSVAWVRDCTITIDDCGFIENVAERHGGVLYAVRSSILLTHSYFHHNTAVRGGVAYSLNSSFNISNSNFTFNKANITGGSMFFYNYSKSVINSSLFSGNSALSFGGALSAFTGTKMFIDDGTIFENNSAYRGGAIFVHGSTEITCSGDLSIRNNIAEFGVVGVFRSKALFPGSTLFSGNIGSLLIFSGNVSISGKVTFLRNKQHNWDTSASNVFLKTQEGGAITLLLSKLDITGMINLSRNTALNGGGILAMTSYIIQRGEIWVMNNTATGTGGGLYLYQSVVFVQGATMISGNQADNYGGGIHTISSALVIYAVDSVLSNNFYVQENSAKYGGGACLEVYSKFHFTPWRQLKISRNLRLNTLVKFIRNTAEYYGGAVYVADNTSTGTCLGGVAKTFTGISQSECFFQVTKIREVPYTLEQVFYFEGNYARVSGAHLFGGLLDRCTVNTFRGHHSITLNYTDNFLEHTTSNPVRVCLCYKNDSTVLCGQTLDPEKVLKGENFSISISAFDQLNHMVNATVNAYLSDKSSRLAHGQYTRHVSASCTELNFSITSTHDYEVLVLYAQGPCNDLGISPLKLEIEFIPCYCPIGFEETKMVRDRCVCTCHSKLLQLPFINELDCNSNTLLIMRTSDFWISTANTSLTNLSFVSAEVCPLLYCVPSTAQVSISLDSPKAADAQCNFNRSGKLCGMCQKGLSLSVGSSRCVDCPHYWYIFFVTTLFSAFLAGLALVTLILISNLTVASGTLNGLIFYANVFSANKGLYMPFQEPNLHSVFIDWLNLDIGIDYCFFDGMDAYTKAWIQFAFPFYVIFIVIAIILASKYSPKFARLIAQRNPIATLATLILLSYAKLLNTIITSMSVAMLLYTPIDGGESYVERVWLYDASVLYFRGKHIPLFIASVLIIIIVFIYTFFLSSWQWLVQLPDKVIFRFIRSTKLSSFMDAYHAPYTARNRYWTGLLLLARVILYLNSAINISGKPSVNLLAVSVVIGGILLLHGYSGIRIYKKWILNVFEFTSYLNILVFTVVKFYVLQTDGNHIAIAYSSISIELVVFCCIIIYHLVTETDILNRIKRATSSWYKVHYGEELHAHLLERVDQRANANECVTFSEIGIMKSNSEEDKDREREDLSILFS